MELSVGFIWFGALLVILGVLLSVAQALFRGRLSEAGTRSQASANRTLEPRKASSGLSLSANWTGITLIVLGCLLLLSSAII